MAEQTNKPERHAGAELPLFEKIKMVPASLLNHREFFNKISGGEGIMPALKFFIVLLVINTVLSAIVSFMTLSLLGSYDLNSIVIISASAGFVASLAGIFFTSGVVHFIATRFFAAKETFDKTFNAMSYGMSPYLLLGWIPLVNLIAGVWALILSILGLAHFQKISNEKALVIYVITIIIFLAIYFAIAAMLAPFGYTPSLI